ncbi:uncharacterized protein Z518_09505 [Rhinocladiella mackenziei CBS 650.93]|uniref:Uncharacterized protein n=1 Tax=Rhinocladiella mackenziei CBS 650.93 TaxID=1442369 RepID=A0A0D2GTV6_9EURO|nr:uncharacterized protein Z518_09505 [Rhinocladiella mackenziei CBS 650.93]KIX01778.1 hypothetical protein Z518_09505 [Rhinocladiella mackenziei CBS 650.93]
MSFFSSNRLVIAALLVGIGAACYTIPALLQQVKDAARAPPPEPPRPTKRLQKDSENSLKIETLRTLADGYSYELRTSTIKIVASRTVRCRAKYLLFRDLASRDYERRDKAIYGLWMLLYHPALQDTMVSNELHEPRACKAVVKALINVLPFHNINPEERNADRQELPPSPIRPAHRPAHEVSLLNVLNNMFHFVSRRRSRQSVSSTMDAALAAGLVTRWLANYPFPCALPENQRFNFKKCDVVRLFDRNAWQSDDPLMATIILEIMQYPLGRKQLREVGLNASSYKENVGRDNWNSGWAASGRADEDNDAWMTGGEETAGVARDDITIWEETSRPISSARPRSTERSQEEEHLRRRHREAIVVAERGAPLRRENILQRENSQILQPMNGVSEVESVLNGLLGLSDTRQAESPQSPPQPLDAISEHDGRAAAEIDRTLDVQEIEHMIQESLSNPDVRRAIQTLGLSSRPVRLVLTDSSGNSSSPAGDGNSNDTNHGEP